LCEKPWRVLICRLSLLVRLSRCCFRSASKHDQVLRHAKHQQWNATTLSVSDSQGNAGRVSSRYSTLHCLHPFGTGHSSVCKDLHIRLKFPPPDPNGVQTLPAGVRLVPREKIDLIRSSASILVLSAASRTDDIRDWCGVRREHEIIIRQGG
jgi:hypothetical protein